MFSIYGGATEFNQWELDKLVTNPCMKEGDDVVFRNSTGETYVVRAFAQNGEVLVDVPNYILKTAGNILVDLVQNQDRHDDCRTTFAVKAANKPDDYDKKCTCNTPDRPVKSGGVTSWNDLTDKPFYSEKAFADIVWDGNIEGLVSVDDTYYKVSDAVLDDDAIKVGVITLSRSDGATEMPVSDIWEDAFSGVDVLNLDAVVFVRKENASDGYVSFPETGVYFAKLGKNTTTKFSAPETIKPIDPKYIVLTSPNGTKYNLSVSDSGTLSATEAN